MSEGNGTRNTRNMRLFPSPNPSFANKPVASPKCEASKQERHPLALRCDRGPLQKGLILNKERRWHERCARTAQDENEKGADSWKIKLAGPP